MTRYTKAELEAMSEQHLRDILSVRGLKDLPRVPKKELVHAVSDTEPREEETVDA